MEAKVVRHCASSACTESLPVDSPARQRFCSKTCANRERVRRWRSTRSGREKKRATDADRRRRAQERRQSERRAPLHDDETAVRLEQELIDALDSLTAGQQRINQFEGEAASLNAGLVEVRGHATELAEIVRAFYEIRDFDGWDGPVRRLCDRYLNPQSNRAVSSPQMNIDDALSPLETAEQVEQAHLDLALRMGQRPWQ